MEVNLRNFSSWEGKVFTTPLNMDLIDRFLQKDDLILDFGCGYGRIIELLTRNGFNNIYGYDPDEYLISIAKDKLPNIKFYNNLDALIKVKEQPKVVLLTAVLTAIASNFEQKKVIEIIYNMMPKGSFLIINDFLIDENERNTPRYEHFSNNEDLPYGVFSIDNGKLILRHHTESHLLHLVSKFNIAFKNVTKFKTINNNINKGIELVLNK